jgi:hypothetical protein
MGSACSLIVSTGNLSGGIANDGSLPLAPESGAGSADGGDAGVETGKVMPSEAHVWSGNGHGYAVYVVPGGISWDAARVVATQVGGHLATIGSKGEEDFVVGLALSRTADAFNGSKVGPWLGGYQPNPTPAVEPAGGWQWVDGTPWTYTDWRPEQPDNGGDENYLDLYHPGGVCAWNDDSVNGSAEPLISYLAEFE